VFFARRVRDGLPYAVKQIKLSAAQNGDKSFYIKCHKEVRTGPARPSLIRQGVITSGWKP
jgi:hypothetical protein